MKSKSSTFVLLTTILFLLGLFSVAFAGPAQGVPFKNLQQQVDNLQQQVDTIELIPGPQGETGPEGPEGPEGPPGEPGTSINPVHLMDSNVGSCEAAQFPNPNQPGTFGWCPNGVRQSFIIPDTDITANSVVIANRGNISLAQCQVRFVNNNLGTFNYFCNAPLANGDTLNYAIINP